jgi:hypothetical protein
MYTFFLLRMTDTTTPMKTGLFSWGTLYICMCGLYVYICACLCTSKGLTTDTKSLLVVRRLYAMRPVDLSFLRFSSVGLLRTWLHGVIDVG